MRVAVVYVSAKKGEFELAGKLAEALKAHGRPAEVLDPDLELGRLPAFEYLAFGVEPEGFFGSLPERLPKLLSSAPDLSGKRCFAFVRRKGFASERALGKLMRLLESEGARVNYAETIKNQEDVERVARTAPVERN